MSTVCLYQSSERADPSSYHLSCGQEFRTASDTRVHPWVLFWETRGTKRPFAETTHSSRQQREAASIQVYMSCSYFETICALHFRLCVNATFSHKSFPPTVILQNQFILQFEYKIFNRNLYLKNTLPYQNSPTPQPTKQQNVSQHPLHPSPHNPHTFHPRPRPRVQLSLRLYRLLRLQRHNLSSSKRRRSRNLRNRLSILHSNRRCRKCLRSSNLSSGKYILGRHFWGRKSVFRGQCCGEQFWGRCREW